MPTYGYECKSCKHTFDVFQSMKDDPLKVCPKCGKTIRRLINGGNGVIFKGSGFYVTDKISGPGKTANAEKTGGAGKAGEPKTSETKTASGAAGGAACQSCPMAQGQTPACPNAGNN